MNANFSLIFTQFRSIFGVLTAELSLFLEEFRRDIHFEAFHEFEFVVRLENHRAHLGDVESLVVVQGELGAY